MASELTRLFDLNTDFCDLCEGQRGVPPSCLKQADLKELYNVSTPAYAASFFNLEILNSKTDDLIQRVKAVAVQAFRNAIDLYYKRADEYRKAGDGRFFAELSFETRVVTYGELLAEVRKISGDAFDKHIKGKIREWEKAGRDKQTISIYIVRELLDFYQDKNPVIVIGFAPPYYPARFPDLSRPEYQRLYENVDAMIAQAQADYGVHLEKYKFFGVSDFSYIECGDREGIGTVAENLLGLGETYQFPAEALSRLAIPGIVFGCWGKDAHKFTERVQVPYSFGMLPALVRDFIYRTFAAG
jgi:arginine utilization protein RocB